MNFRVLFPLINCIAFLVDYSSSTNETTSETRANECVYRCPLPIGIEELENRPPNTGEIFRGLIRNCSYDRLRPPPTSDAEPVKVYVKVYFYFLKSYEAYNLQFTVYLMLQCRFLDPRLRFDPEDHNLTEIVGTKELAQLLWVPHIYFNNERHSLIMGPGESDVQAHIVHDGTVLYTKRMHTTLFCWMKLQKFPFDSQECSLVLDSWSYNTSYLTLEWEEINPVHCRDHLSLTEFSLVGKPVASSSTDKVSFDHEPNGDFQGNYSSLTVTFHLQRESGFYIYDYYIPSILLVVVSWVSFWLEADAQVVSGRVILGFTTMLAFIILSLKTGNSLPKVSYIKASEIWFLGCTAFIFGSLVEFAFANNIYRSHRKTIELKKLNSKYVLKEALTPKAKRKAPSIERSSSCPRNLNLSSEEVNRSRSMIMTFSMEESHDDCQSLPTLDSPFSDTPKTNSDEKKKTARKYLLQNIWKHRKKPKEEVAPTLMTPVEVSIWIDERSRIVFPVSFLCFLLIYWCYVYHM